MSFNRTAELGIELWAGLPDCQTAHDYLLLTLQNMGANFISATDDLDERRQGNLGEFIAFRIGCDHGWGAFQKFAPNALEPLKAISNTDMDLAYVFFGNDPVEDFLIIQEVKTTTVTTLSLANRLISDYAKLFGENPGFTLQSRVQVMNSRMSLERNQPELAFRLLALAEDSPAACTRVHLYPTLVHEKIGAAPVPKLLAVRTAIVAQGWSQQRIKPWSISLTDLEDRLTRLARGLT